MIIETTLEKEKRQIESLKMKPYALIVSHLNRRFEYYASIIDAQVCITYKKVNETDFHSKQDSTNISCVELFFEVTD